MSEEPVLSRETFLHLAREAGLDTGSPHMEELFHYTANVLAGLQSLKELDVAGAEPDMAFVLPEE